MSEAAAEIQRMRTVATKRCAICETPRPEHDRKVAAGELHHRFSEAGELVHSTERRPQVPKTADLALRVALIDAGVITYEQIARAEAKLRDLPVESGADGRGDRGDRPAESS